MALKVQKTAIVELEKKFGGAKAVVAHDDGQTQVSIGHISGTVADFRALAAGVDEALAAIGE